ncbi:MAG TPA: hypothetical protein PLG31_09145 [Spirochaetota bacterium]|nr:hypothetical protein [Spirochaetota bacterium]
MTRRLLAGVLALAIVGMPSLARAMGKSFAMGGVQSVLSDGAYDAAKNPALLPLHTEGAAAGLIVRSLAGYSFTGSSYVYFQDGERGITAEMRDVMLTLYGVDLCFLARIGGSVVGVSVTDGSDPQYMRVTSNNTIAISNAIVETKGDDTTYAPALNLSWGMTISAHTSIGLVLSGKHTGKHSVEGKSMMNEGRELYYITKTTDTSTTSASLGFGLLYRTDDAQAGIAVLSGDVTWIGQTGGYDYADKRYLINPSIEDRSGSEDALVTSSGVYTKGPMIVAGGYRRLSPMFAVAVEGSYVFRNSYRSRAVTVSDPNSNGECAVTEIAVITRQSGTTGFRGGVEFTPLTGLSFMLGGAYSYERTGSDTPSSSDRTNSAYQTTGKESLTATGGVVYSSPQRFSVGIIAAYGDTVIRERKREYSGNGDLTSRSTSRMSLRLTMVGLSSQFIF